MAIIQNTGKRTFKFKHAEGLPDLAPGTHDVPNDVYLRMRELLDFDSFSDELVVSDSAPADAPSPDAEEPVTKPGRKTKAAQ